MSISNVNRSEVKKEIDAIYQAKSAIGRNEVLNGISDMAKELINNLNSMDESVYNISEEYDDLADEISSMQVKYNEAVDEEKELTITLDGINKRIEEIEKKLFAGEELTQEEKDELRHLYQQRKYRQYDSDTNDGVLSNLSNKLTGSQSRLADDFATLRNIVGKMDGYKEAGDEITKAAETYGNAVNCKTIMERNETTWWDFFGWSEGNGNTLTDKYLANENLIETSDDSGVFYSETAHKFVAEYDVLIAKGGNQIQGESNHAKTKAFSYGTTIETASEIIKDKAQKSLKK